MEKISQSATDAEVLFHPSSHPFIHPSSGSGQRQDPPREDVTITS